MFLLRLVFSILLLAMLVSPGMTQTKSSLADFSWLSGCWEGRQRDAVIEEIWSKPAGQSMLGLGRTVKNNRTTSFEFMQLREENGSVVFLPQPQGGTRVPFPLEESIGDKATFENKEHDFPQRVIYERKGKGLLLASIEGTLRGKQQRDEFLMKKVRCD